MKSEIVKHSDEIAASESDEDVGLTINTSLVSTLATPFGISRTKRINDPDVEKDVIGEMVCDYFNETEVSKYSLTREWSTCIESSQKCNIM